MPEMAQEVRYMTDLSAKTIQEITFQEISRITQGISKETAMRMKKIEELQKRIREINYDSKLFY
jgi:hypothetical protein